MAEITGRFRVEVYSSHTDDFVYARDGIRTIEEAEEDAVFNWARLDKTSDEICFSYSIFYRDSYGELFKMAASGKGHQV